MNTRTKRNWTFTKLFASASVVAGLAISATVYKNGGPADYGPPPDISQMHWMLGAEWGRCNTRFIPFDLIGFPPSEHHDIRWEFDDSMSPVPVPSPFNLRNEIYRGFYPVDKVEAFLQSLAWLAMTRYHLLVLIGEIEIDEDVWATLVVAAHAFIPGSVRTEFPAQAIFNFNRSCQRERWARAPWGRSPSSSPNPGYTFDQHEYIEYQTSQWYSFHIIYSNCTHWVAFLM